MTAPQLVIFLIGTDYERVVSRAQEHPEEIRQGNHSSTLIWAIKMLATIPIDTLEVLIERDVAYASENGLVPAMLRQYERKELLSDDLAAAPTPKYIALLELVARYVPECLTEAYQGDHFVYGNFLIALIHSVTEDTRRRNQAAFEYVSSIRPLLLMGCMTSHGVMPPETIVQIILSRVTSVPECFGGAHKHDWLQLALPDDQAGGNYLHRIISSIANHPEDIGHFLTFSSDDERVELLKAQNAAGETPLMQALRTNKLPFIMQLLKAVPKYDQKLESIKGLLNQEGKSTLEVAISSLESNGHMIRHVAALYPAALESLNYWPVQFYPYVLASPPSQHREQEGGHDGAARTNSTWIFEMLKACPQLVRRHLGSGSGSNRKRRRQHDDDDQGAR